MCGIVGMVVASGGVAQPLYDALTVLQHRGQDAAGIATCGRGKLRLRKSNGLVRDVFSGEHMRRLTGNVGIGHVRYPTAGTSRADLAQPMYVNSPYGICLGHNGNLTNARQLKQEVFKSDLRHLNTDSDSEVLLNVLAHELGGRKVQDPTPEDIFAAVQATCQRVRGAYSVVCMLLDIGIFAFRDPHGIRPLIYGRRDSDQGTEYMIASESAALTALEFQPVRDLAPGEVVFISCDGEFHARQCLDSPVQSPCIFEWVYLARPDSVLDGISVYQSRRRMGKRLARKLEKDRPDLDIDVIVPVPDSSTTSALAMANHLGVKYREGLVKNRYVGRTFIMPLQRQRRQSVRRKLNAIEEELRGKKVMLVDDSIVRGTTSSQVVEMIRECGASEVYFASAAPPVRYQNVYGIDMAALSELVAHGRDEEEVARVIGADWLLYQDLDDLTAACRESHATIARFDCSIFDGEYVTADVDRKYLDDLERRRRDAEKVRLERLEEEIIL